MNSFKSLDSFKPKLLKPNLFKSFRLVFFSVLFFSVSFCSDRSRKPRFFDDSITRVDLSALLRQGLSPSEKKKGLDRVILLEKVLYRLETDGTTTIQVHQIIQVLKASESLKYYSFSYREGFEWLQHLEAYQVTPEKKKIPAEIETSFPFDNESIRFPLYQELRRKEIRFEPIQKGSTLHIRYQIRKENPLEKGILEGRIYLGSAYPVIKQKVVILTPSDIPLSFQVSGTSQPLEKWVQKIEKGKWHYYIVEREKLPVFSSNRLDTRSDTHSEPDSQTLHSFKQLPQIRFSSFSSWMEIAQRLRTWFSLSEKRHALDSRDLELKKKGFLKDALKQKAFEILRHVQKHAEKPKQLDSIDRKHPKDMNSKEMHSKESDGLAKQEEWARDIYHFVTSTQNITNAGVYFGLAGYQPHQPDQVLDEGYGDAKDKAFLLFSLLSSLGLSVDLAFTSESEPLDFPMLSSLDRILVRLLIRNQKKQTIRYLDPYSAIIRYGFLPQGLYGKKVLIPFKSAQSSKIETIPMLKSSENVFAYYSESKILESGDLEYSTRFEPQGLHEVLERSRMFQVLLSNPLQPLKKNYRSIYENPPQVRILDFSSTAPMDLSQKFTYSVQFLLRDFLSFMSDLSERNTQMSNRFYVDPELHYPLIFSEEDWKTNFRVPFLIQTENRLQYPKDWTLETVPKTVVLTLPQYSYRREFHIQEPGTVLYRRHFEVKVPISSYSFFQDFLGRLGEKIHLQEKEFLIFTRSSETPPLESLPKAKK